MLIAPSKDKSDLAPGVIDMSGFVRICSQSELPGAGEVKEFVVNGHPYCVANVDGTIGVLDGVCPHEEGPLSEGSVEAGRVVCPWHGYAFDIRSGESEQDPDVKAKVFEKVIEDGELRAKI
jgi:nitrite reductase (NADH) small subunit